jgi:hypothetical protein
MTSHTGLATADTTIARRGRTVFAGLAAFACLVASPAAARLEPETPCGSYIGLAFLGTNSDATATCFLTAIRPPAFEFGDALALRHDATRTPVDAFSVAKPPGLRHSASGFVAPDAGGRHTLYERRTVDSAVACAEQEGGIVLSEAGGGWGGGGGGVGGGDGTGGGRC